MKTLLLFIGLLFFGGSVWSQSRSLSSSKKGWKKGIIEEKNGKKIQILPAKYKSKKIDDKCYLFYKKENYKKNYYQSVLFLDSTLHVQKEFKKVFYTVPGDYYLVEKDNKWTLYNPIKDHFLFQGANKIYQTSINDDYDKVVVVKNDQKTVIYNEEYKLLFSVPFSSDVKVISASTEIFQVRYERDYNDFWFPFLAINKSLYKINGEKIMSSVLKVKPKGSFRNGKTKKYVSEWDGSRRLKTVNNYDVYWSFQLENDSVAIIKNYSIFWGPVQGKSIWNITNPNKIIVEKENGYAVYDSLGTLWSDSLFQDVLKDYTAVKYEDQWFAIDEHFLPIDDQKYANIQRVGPLYKVIQNDGSTYVYNFYYNEKEKNYDFKKGYSQPIKSVKYYNEYGSVVLENDNGKKALFSQYFPIDSLVVDFTFDDIEPLYNEETDQFYGLYKGEIDGNVLLIDEREGAFFGKEELNDIDYFINQNTDFGFLLAEKNRKHSVITPYQIKKGEDYSRAYKINEEVVFDEVVMGNEDFYYDRFFVKNNGKWGEIEIHPFKQNNSVLVLIPLEYDNIY